MPSTPTRIALATGLFFPAPLMGEYLIGDVPRLADLPGFLLLDLIGQTLSSPPCCPNGPR